MEQERRQAQRVAAQWKLRLLDGEHTQGVGRSINLSTGGMKFELEQCVRQGEELTVEVYARSAHGNKTLNFTCRVTYTVQMLGAYECGCGVRFLELPPDAQAWIARYLDNHLSRQGAVPGTATAVG